MNSKFKRLDQNAVISSKENVSRLIYHTTFKVTELLEAIQNHTGEHKEWLGEGMDCEVLSLNQGWQKGKVRWSLEFCPDEPDLTNPSGENDETSSQPESPLDDIRRTIVD
ncbi:KGK domain-containing protein [Leptolyngbya sp. FACHB-541]|uniref:KGK domain-containing protein n=1 Tax=Leptolyngbya sp. FACHB-541 TaxID=2692810 RepID=UPI0016863BBB|nr:KGK domain-containing protein [Leptolyngbya sp. FACHB-541]MBD1995878.1 KGK domain-containing protein [Leptolyngbya sp. FACHB-541]